jgi:hypothetical protein
LFIPPDEVLDVGGLGGVSDVDALVELLHQVGPLPVVGHAKHAVGALEGALERGLVIELRLDQLHPALAAAAPQLLVEVEQVQRGLLRGVPGHGADVVPALGQ